MASQTWEQDRINLLKLSNEESHRVAMESIEIALLWLMKERDYASISITDIVKKSGVSRSAFYKNYHSKDEVLQRLLEHNMMKIMSSVAEKTAAADRDYWEVLFESLAPYSEIYQVIFAAGQTGLLYDVFNAAALQSLDLFDEKNEYFMLFYVGGITNILIHWIEGGMKEDAAEMSRILNIMISDH